MLISNNTFTLRHVIDLKSAIFIISLLWLTGCKSTLAHLEQQAHPPGATSHFEGILVYDPIAGDTVYEHHSNKYFTPASNIKILTLFAALKTLPERLPSVQYIGRNDTLYLEGLGDPTFLHPFFMDSTALKLASPYRHLAVSLTNFKDTPWAPGWAWEDYDRNYNVERSGFPIYGNIVTVENAGAQQVRPAYFSPNVVPVKYLHQRDRDKNRFYVDPSQKYPQEIPFIVDSTLIKELLTDALQKEVRLIPQLPSAPKAIAYSIPSDSLYTRMMQESDNFLAEQILVMVSATLSDTLDTAKARKHVLDTFLMDLAQRPKWVDGSGLSRYNLCTPESLVAVLHQLYREIPTKRLLGLFPVGGVSGTLKKDFAGEGEPYVYAKSGSMGNMYNLSGYLITRSGKTLIFSFMNNHFTKSSQEIKQHIQGFLERLRDTY